MTNFGTKTILINDLTKWGVTVNGDGAIDGTWATNDVLVKIPGFGAFYGGDDGSGNLIKGSRLAIAGAAGTNGAWTITVAGDLSGTPSTASFVVEYNTLREEALGARLDQTPGRKFPFTVKGDTAVNMAAAVKAQMDDNELFSSLFTVTIAAGVITLTAKGTDTWVEAAYTGFGDNPYVESAETGREVPGIVTGAVAQTVAPVAAKGLGSDIEEDELLDTAWTVAPYAEEITDRPIKSALYNEIYFEIPTTNEHELSDAPSISSGRRSLLVYVLKTEWDTTALKAALEEAFGIPA